MKDNDKPLDITQYERKLLSGIRSHPEMYLGEKSSNRLTALIHGYASALYVSRISPTEHNIFPFDNMQPYDGKTSLLFGVIMGESHWLSYFYCKTDDNEELFDAFFECLDQKLMNDGFTPLANEEDFCTPSLRLQTAEFPYDITEKERELLSGIRRNYFLFLRTYSFNEFCAWVEGYILALAVTSANPNEHNLLPLVGLDSFAAEKLLSSDNKDIRSWQDIIRYAEPDDEKALDVFFKLLDEYLLSLGYKAIPANIKLPPKEGERLDITPDERRLLSGMRRRPGMYLGTKSLAKFDAWLSGYTGALLTLKIPHGAHNILPIGEIDIHDYAAEKYLGKGEASTCGWINCILAYEPDDKKALDECFKFLDEYLIASGFEPIPDWDATYESKPKGE